MREIYSYSGVLTRTDNRVQLEFPDIPDCSLEGQTVNDVLPRAVEIMALCLYDLQARGEALPEATPMRLFTSKGISIVQTSVHMPAYQFAIGKVSEEFNLPVWLWRLLLESVQGIGLSHRLLQVVGDYLNIGRELDDLSDPEENRE